MAKHSIQELKTEFQKLRSVTPWDEVKADETYHVPPLLSLERRDLTILTKDGKKATYKRIGDTEEKERTMYDSSVFARFLVKKRAF